MDDSIYLHVSMTGSIKLGSRKLLNTKMPLEAGLVVVYCNMEGQERFTTITKVGLTLR